MASGHTFTLYLALRDDLSPVELQTLDYLFNGRADAPDEWPEHAFLELETAPYPLGGPSVFPPGAYVSASWRASDHPGMFSGLHFVCPNLKMDEFIEYHFHLAQWLATLSSSRGHVGALTNQDDGQGLPWLFYVYDRQLYINIAEPGIALHAADSGDEYPWPDSAEQD